MKKMDRAKGKPITIITGVLIIIAIVFSLIYYNFQNNKLFKERKAFFSNFSEKVTENIEMVFSTIWDQTKSCDPMLRVYDVNDEKTLLQALESMQEIVVVENSVIMAFNEDGRFYTADGQKGRLSESIDVSFCEKGNEEQLFVINLPYISTTNSYYLFLRRLDTPVILKDAKEITHIALAVDINSFQEIFTTEGFQDKCYTYFINQEGRRLYKNTYAHDFFEGYNVMNFIRDSAEILKGGTIEEFVKSVREKQDFVCEIKYKENRWFMSSTVLEIADCTLLLFVPAELLSTETASLQQGTLTFIAAIFIIFCILLDLILKFRKSYAEQDRLLLAKEKEMNVRLEKEIAIAASASKAKSEFLSYMSHDIRTPLNGIMGMTDIAIKNIDNESKALECLNKIGESSKHLLYLLNDVLDMSRIESGKISKEMKPMNMEQLINNCCDVVEGQIKIRDLDFVCDVEPFAHPYLMGDGLHLSQILINILGNAIKYTQDGGKISFRIKEIPTIEEKARFVFEVEDTGIGMSEEFLEHIWDPFTQENKGSKTNYTGTGLGMAITKKFVELLEGTIEVSSEVDKGSIFRVEVEFDIDHNETAEAGAELYDFKIEGMRILIAEDNEFNREITEEKLKEAGAEVLSVENGKEAVEAVLSSEKGTFDAILMDIMMPEMDGLEATRKIRASNHPDAATIPIIATTANVFAEDMEKTKTAGMSAHLSKPFSKKELIRILYESKSSESSDIEEKPSVKTALLVDDQEINLEIATYQLQEKGLYVVAATNGEEARNLYLSEPAGSFDVIFMDVNMPVMDGLEATRQIRASGHADAKTIPIIAMTGSVFEEDVEAAMKAGMTAYLSKPLEPNKLDEVLEQI